MTVTADSPFKAGPRMTRERFERVLHDAGSPWAAKAGALYDLIAGNGHDPAVWLAICGREHTFGTNPDSVLHRNQTNSWTNARSIRHPQIRGEIISDAVRGGPYVRYRSVEDSLRDGMYRVDDPAYVYRQRGADTIGEVLSIWTESGGEEYTAYVLARMNAWEEAVMGLTETIRDRLTRRGLEVHDIRGRMARHRTDRYERLPNSAWIYTGVHHTAVSRGIRQVEGDIESWIGHSRYHVETHGWPGIAYAIGLSQSGRVFILRDAEEMGFHAFNANANTFAVCGDLGDANAPTARILDSLKKVLWTLHEDCPEFANLKGFSGTYGHQELKFIDARNQTGCPGRLLPFVREYREGKHRPQQVPDGEPALPPTAPDPWKAGNPYSKSLWIPLQFIDHIKAGDWMTVGFCVAPAEVEDGRIVQYFERARLELHPGGQVMRGLVGIEARKWRHPEWRP